MWIWSTNVQLRCTWKSWLANLRNFYARDTFYASFHRSIAFTFVPGFVANSTIYTICGYIVAADQITHRIPAISNWNFWFCRSRVYGYKPNFSKLVILSIPDSAPDEDRNLQEGILPNQMIRKLNLILLLIV